MTITEHDWDRAVAVLSGARSVALACHVDPDGDALGSMLALRAFMAGRGVEVVASWGGSGLPAVDGDGDGHAESQALAIPPQYTFLPGLADLTPAAHYPQAPEVLVAFDTGSADRLGSLQAAAEAAGTLVVIDHHASGKAFGDIRLIDGRAAATAMLVEELIRRMGGTLDQDMATCLYVGLVTDTGRFQYASTTPAVMELGARLIAHDIDHAAINRRVWDTHSFGYLKLLGRALERAVLVPEAALAWTAVTSEDLDDLGIAMQETEGLIDVLRAVEIAEVALVCKQQPGADGRGADGSGAVGSGSRWKVSLRSKGRVDVGALATELGGGGHAFAAGFTGHGSLDEVVDRVVALLGGRVAVAGAV